MTEAVIFIGAQAAGKSTFYRDRFFRTHVRINLDMLRTRNREKRLFETCLETQQAFVIDNTNPTEADRARYIGPARDAGFRVTGYYFQSRLKDLLRRNEMRSDNERIPEKGLRGTYAKLVMPRRSEGFDDLYFVRLREPAGFLIENWIDEV